MGCIWFTEGSNLEKQSPQAPGYFRHHLACAVFSLFFFFSASQTPWKRKPSERMMGTEGHCGFKHTHGHSPICLAHNLLCWQTKQSKETLAVFIEAWLKASYILKPDGAEQRRCWRYYAAHCFHTVLQLLPLYPLTICSEYCVSDLNWQTKKYNKWRSMLKVKCIVSVLLAAEVIWTFSGKGRLKGTWRLSRGSEK